MDNAERIRLQKNILMRINKQHSRLISKWEKLDERINEYEEDLDEEYDAIESITDLNLKGSIEVKNYQQDLENKLSKIEEKLQKNKPKMRTAFFNALIIIYILTLPEKNLVKSLQNPIEKILNSKKNI